MPISVGLTWEFIKRRQDLLQAWYSILIADTELSIPKKNRFPAFSLVGLVNNASKKLSQVSNETAPTWSLSYDISQPVFNAGRLKAIEEQAKTGVKQAEQRYAQKLFLAFF